MLFAFTAVCDPGDELLVPEPYYTNYLEDDLSAVFEDAGFEVASIDRAFFSRVMVLRRLA